MFHTEVLSKKNLPYLVTKAAHICIKSTLLAAEFSGFSITAATIANELSFRIDLSANPAKIRIPYLVLRRAYLREVKNLKRKMQNHSVKFKSECSVDGLENFGIISHRGHPRLRPATQKAGKHSRAGREVSG